MKPSTNTHETFEVKKKKKTDLNLDVNLQALLDDEPQHALLRRQDGPAELVTFKCQHNRDVTISYGDTHDW